MTITKLLGATAIAATMMTGSAMAQSVVTNSERCTMQSADPACQNLGRHGYRHHRVSYRESRDDWNRTHTGFWPADAAGDVAGAAIGTAGAVTGAAIGTAGAIATAPFRGFDNSYAYDNRGWDHRTYAQRNNFVCTPGTWFKGEDGRRHICQ